MRGLGVFILEGMKHSHPGAASGAVINGTGLAQKSPESSGHPLLDNLLQLRDEIRSHMHLASMEARAQWQLLEREIHSVSALMNMAKADRHVVLHELRIRVERFARRLGEPDAH